MLRQKTARGEEILDAEAGRELTESELAAICGGAGGSSGPDLSGLYNFPNLTNVLNPQSVSTNTKGNTTANRDGAGKITGFPGLTGLGSLSTLTSGLINSLM